jgi:hypothetical protein
LLCTFWYLFWLLCHWILVGEVENMWEAVPVRDMCTVSDAPVSGVESLVSRARS